MKKILFLLLIFVFQLTASSATLNMTNKNVLSDGNMEETGYSALFPFGPESAGWVGLGGSPDGDIYAIAGTALYKQTLGIGSFALVASIASNLRSVAVTPSGDVYVTAEGVDIYKQTGGTGDFVALEQGTLAWWGLCAAPNGDVYASVRNGDIYKQTGGTGDFVALSQTTRLWTGMAATSGGDIYAVVNSGDIYKQAGGVGDFIALSQTSRQWFGIAILPSGDLYAVASGAGVYKQTGGVGDFNLWVSSSLAFRGIFSNNCNGDIYITANSYPMLKSVYGMLDWVIQDSLYTAKTSGKVFEGQKVMRMFREGGEQLVRAVYQNILSIGKPHRVTGWFKTEGAAYAYISTTAVAYDLGTSVGVWKWFDKIIPASAISASTLELRGSFANLNESIYWDNVVVSEYNGKLVHGDTGTLILGQ
jgi:hypothetical protein